jgi:hypothetical protein
MMRRRAVLLAAAASATFALATPAGAHAMLETARPRVGSIIAAAPAELRLRFSERVVPALSRVQLLDPGGAAVSLGALFAQARDRHTLCAPVRGAMTIGVYHVRWRAVSADSHVTEGEFSFTLRA